MPKKGPFSACVITHHTNQDPENSSAPEVYGTAVLAPGKPGKRVAVWQTPSAGNGWWAWSWEAPLGSAAAVAVGEQAEQC